MGVNGELKPSTAAKSGYKKYVVMSIIVYIVSCLYIMNNSNNVCTLYSGSN